MRPAAALLCTLFAPWLLLSSSGADPTPGIDNTTVASTPALEHDEFPGNRPLFGSAVELPLQEASKSGWYVRSEAGQHKKTVSFVVKRAAPTYGDISLLIMDGDSMVASIVLDNGASANKVYNFTIEEKYVEDLKLYVEYQYNMGHGGRPRYIPLKNYARE